MADQTELLKIILDVAGSEELDRLRAKLDEQRAALAQAASALKGYDAAALAADPAVRSMAAGIQDTSARIATMEKSLGMGRSGMAGFGQSIMQASRGIQDFQAAGLMGIVNNIESIVMAMGGSAGLAGVLTLVAVGLQVVGPKLAEFWGQLTGEASKAAVDRLDELKGRVKELEKLGPTRLAVETIELEEARAEIDRLVAAKKQLDLLMGKQNEVERLSGAGVERTLTGPEAREAVKGAVESRTAELTKESEGSEAKGTLGEVNARLARMRRNLAQMEANPAGGGDPLARQGAIENLKKSIARANDEAFTILSNIEKQAETDVGDLEKRAIHGAGGDQDAAQRELADTLERTGSKDLADQVRGKSQEEVQKQKAAEVEARRTVRQIEKDQAEAEKRRKAEEADVDAEAAFHADELAGFTRQVDAKRKADRSDLTAEKRRRAALVKREGLTDADAGPRAPRAPRGLNPIDQLTLDAGMGGTGMGGPQFPNTSRGRARMMAAQRKQFNANMRQMRRAMSPAGRRDRAALAALRKGAGNYIHGARADAEGNKPDDLMKNSDETVKLLTRLVEKVERSRGLILP